MYYGGTSLPRALTASAQFPAFSLQLEMRRAIFGENYWKHVSNNRKRFNIAAEVHALAKEKERRSSAAGAAVQVVAPISAD